MDSKTGEQLMKDSHARGWAKQLGAEVLRYEQGPAECAATCALWIRRQLKEKSIFNPKRLWRAPEAPSKARYKKTDDFDDKIDVLKITIRNQTRDLYSKLNAEDRYITQGSQGPDQKFGQKGFRDTKQDRHIAEKVITNIRVAMGKKGKGALDTFKHTYDHDCIATIGYDMEDEGKQFSHAVAIDCLKSPQVIFFDPLVGQFTFPTYETFKKWWRICWRERKNKDGEANAWSNIRENGSARIEGMYKNPE